jgi:streptogramin lyase
MHPIGLRGFEIKLIEGALPVRHSCAIVLVSCALLLSGCSVGPVATSTSKDSVPGVAFKGMVHGGQSPIVGATVYLYAANTTGYVGLSLSRLTNPVTTVAGGAFSITGDYTCPSAASQLYIYSAGGNSGSGTNTAAGLLAALGTCPASGTLSSSLYVVVNEVSTVAAAYAIAGYATDATHVSSPNAPLALTGIANAFATATNLETLSTGVALATTPVANGGNGTVPQSEINTLANILAACVNTNGSMASGSPCSTLFANALSGGTTGTPPTDTATAAINIAHNPGANITNLYGLQTGSTTFQPDLGTQPNDFTIALSFTGGGIDGPDSLAVDGSGNVWVANSGNNTVSKFNGATGAPISTAGGYTGGAGDITAPFAIAIDQSGNAWVANFEVDVNNGVTITEVSPPSVSELTSSGAGATGSPFTGGGLNNNGQNGGSPRDIAFDANGNAWIANNSGSLTELNGTNGAAISPATTGFPISPSGAYPSGVAVDSAGHVWVAGYLQDYVYEMDVSNGSQVGTSTAGVGTLQEPYSIAIDASNNLWLPNYYDSNVLAGISVSELTSLTAGSVYNPGGLSDPSGIAVDGAGNVWVASGIGDVVELNNSGAAVSPSAGYTSSALGSAFDVAVDGSGNVWVANALVPVTYAPGVNVVEFVGAATPVVTPLATGVKEDLIGSRPVPIG